MLRMQLHTLGDGRIYKLCLICVCPERPAILVRETSYIHTLVKTCLGAEAYGKSLKFSHVPVGRAKVSNI